jgi:hypothetical protein
MRLVSPEFSRISFGNFRHSLIVLMLTAELAGCRPDVATEDAREQFLVAEAGYPVMWADRLVGLDQIPFRRFDSDAPNFRRRRASY